MGRTRINAGISSMNDLRAEIERILEWGDGEHCLLKLHINGGIGGGCAYAAVREYCSKSIIPAGNYITAYVMPYCSYSNGDFEYEIFNESDYPAHLTCPVSILNMLTPTTNPAANAWREACRKKHDVHVEQRKRAKALRELPENTVIRWTYTPTGKTYILQKICRKNGQLCWVNPEYKRVPDSVVNDGKWEVI